MALEEEEELIMEKKTGTVNSLTQVQGALVALKAVAVVEEQVLRPSVVDAVAEVQEGDLL